MTLVMGIVNVTPDSFSDGGSYKNLDDVLYRAEQMIQEGAIEEVAALEGTELSATASKTLGLEQIRHYLQGRLTRAELVQEIALATRQYAKRQRTWLRREKWLTPIEVTAGDTPRQIAEKIAGLLR